MPINFFKENITFRFNKREEISLWIKMVIKKEGKSLENLNFIFCNDSYLRKINKEFLQHDYNTDIITFDNSTEKEKIEGDIFISAERVKVNAKEYKTSFADELHRVIIHGILHLCGYSDKSEKSQKEMRVKEDQYLSRRSWIK
jgi:probable rRNA maturation factor